MCEAMPAILKTDASLLTEPARQRRIEVLSTLLAICRSLERMQTAAASRSACREVYAQLAALRERERSGRPFRP